MFFVIFLCICIIKIINYNNNYNEFVIAQTNNNNNNNNNNDKNEAWKEHELKVAEKLPDYGDAQVAQKLRCTACRAISEEISVALSDLVDRKRLSYNKIKSYDKLQVLSGICKNLSNEYGLLMKNNEPTHVFSKDGRISRAKGNWVTSFLSNTCGEVLDEFEDAIVDAKSLRDDYSNICKKKYSCSSHLLVKEEL